MPSVTVHLRLAQRALDRWRTRPRDAPSDPGGEAFPFQTGAGKPVRTRGDCLEDLNLDTGGPDLEEVGYGGLHRAIDYIQARGGRCPTLPEAAAQGA